MISRGPAMPLKPAQPLRRRAYKGVTVEAYARSAIPPPPAPPHKGEGSQGAYRVLLDGKAVRTPAGRELILPTRALAEAVAAEWAAQAEHIDPATMPLTRLANSAIDGVRGQEGQVRGDILKYATSDLVCYRADGPEALARQQSALWDPVLAWSRDSLGGRFAVAQGIMPVAQPEAARVALARALEDYEAFQLTALHVMTTLTGSALLALAHAHGRFAAEAVWAAAHVDEDWQITQWGADAEAEVRRRHRLDEFEAASRLLELLALD